MTPGAILSLLDDLPCWAVLAGISLAGLSFLGALRALRPAAPAPQLEQRAESPDEIAERFARLLSLPAVADATLSVDGALVSGIRRDAQWLVWVGPGQPSTVSDLAEVHTLVASRLRELRARRDRRIQ